MLDIKYIKENRQKVKENAENRNIKIDVDKVIDLYNQMIKVKQEIEEKNQLKNEISKGINTQETDRQLLVDEAKDIRKDLAQLKDQYTNLEIKYKNEALKIPNVTASEVPVGDSDSDNKVMRKEGEPRKFNFKTKNHLEICEYLDLADFKAGAKVTGSKFYFLKNAAVDLEMAIVKYALTIAKKYDFSPMTTPVIAKNEILIGAGFNPRGPESQIFGIEDTDLSLIGTSEITIGGYMSDTIVSQNQLPIKIVAVTDCFRKETGGYGQINKGLYRVPFFKKVEMFQFTHPDDSERLLEDMLKIEEEIYKSLGLPYQVVSICTGDLGGPAYKKYDIEAWMPFIGKAGGYGEVTSVSNCTDFQARRWNIKYKDSSGKKGYVHTLNGTAVATTRVLLAILENYQQEDGSVQIPDVLVPYMDGLTSIINSK